MAIQRRYFLALILGLFSVLSPGYFGLKSREPIQPELAQSSMVTVSVAISLKDALGEVKNLYEKQTQTKITYNFGASGSLQQQIEQGAPVDLFISAANKQIDALEKQNLLARGTRQILARNQLVLITPQNETKIQKFTDLTQPSVTKIAMGEPKSVPAGQYGAEVLKFYNLLEALKPKIIYAKDVRQVLTYVETGNVNAGMVYATDAKTSQKVNVVATAPKESHAPIVYPMAVLKNSKNLNTAQSFAKFLISKPSKAVFKKYSFIF